MSDGDKVVKLGVEFRRTPLIGAAEMWESPEPSELMIWEVCVYTRTGGEMVCRGCPAVEDVGGHGLGTRMCRLLAAEACRVMMAVQRREKARNR